MRTQDRPQHVLEGDAARAVAHRGSHIQIIAAAGSGKTEVVSQRVASLLETEPPESIVAFTFTEKAATELKDRIRRRVTERHGPAATDQLGRLFVGTIHGYCFRLLQTHVPHYETYEPLDDNRLVNFLNRENRRLGIKELGNGVFAGMKAFRKAVDVVENELIDPSSLPEGEFRTSLLAYYDCLDDYRLLTFGTQIVRAVEALEDPQIRERVTAELRHLIVDEYQDINPAQERLISLLAKPVGTADLVVVGDDDQAVHQWRGSTVRNIVTFTDRYPDVATFHLLTNRRSRPQIVAVANGFAQSIPDRLPKQMDPHRADDGTAVSIRHHAGEDAEAESIAEEISTLYEEGVPYRDMAILVRSRSCLGPIVDALEEHGIPVQSAGGAGLFDQPEADVLGATYCWLTDVDWAPRRADDRETVDLNDLLESYDLVFELGERRLQELRDRLVAWKVQVGAAKHDEGMLADLNRLLELLEVRRNDPTEEAGRLRLAPIARFSTVLGDYEAVARRSRQDPSKPGEQVGAKTWDSWYYKNFAVLLVNSGTDGYAEGDGEHDPLGDAVTLSTVHGAKGLEWPVVFLPAVAAGRFPSKLAGRTQSWLVPRDQFDAERYEGSDGEERRIFYVGLTRARDRLLLSTAELAGGIQRSASPYLLECVPAVGRGGPANPVEAKHAEQTELSLTYSDLARYLNCPTSYLLRSRLGFQGPIEREIGYGNAVHHVMRVIAEQTQRNGALPSPTSVDDLLVGEFFLPFANRLAHQQMRAKARQLVDRYLADHAGDLLRTWATERPVELYLDGVVVRGRADVIYDGDGSKPGNLVLVGYKTSTGGGVEPLQLQVYADAGRREGLTVQAAYVHDMATAQRHAVAVDDGSVRAAEAIVQDAASRLREQDFAPRPDATKCSRCDVRRICAASRC